MENEQFVKNYVQPSTAGLDRQFTLPLPDSTLEQTRTESL